MKRPLVSVITFVYANDANDRIEQLKECLESVRDQHYPNYEHIIIDDGSDTELEPLLLGFDNIVYLPKKGTGILSSTMTFNLGHQVATGKYCIYLPSDDTHLSGAIDGLVECLESQKNAMCCIGNAVYVDNTGNETFWKPNQEKIMTSMAEGNYVNGCAVMWRRDNSLLHHLPPNYTGFCSDYDFFATLVNLGEVAFADVNVVQYKHAGDSTRNKTRSRVITSPRKEDSLFYQYSKSTRQHFVKLRILREDMEKPTLSKELSSSLNENTLNNSHKKRLADFISTRKWKNAQAHLLALSPDYKILSDQIAANDSGLNVVKFDSLSLSAIVFMQNHTENCVFDFSYEGRPDNWLFDFCPIPIVRNIYLASGAKNRPLENYLGF